MPNSYTPLALVDGSSPNGKSQLEYGPFDFDYLNKDDIKFTVYAGTQWDTLEVASVNETTKYITLTNSIVAQYGALLFPLVIRCIVVEKRSNNKTAHGMLVGCLR